MKSKLTIYKGKPGHFNKEDRAWRNKEGDLHKSLGY